MENSMRNITRISWALAPIAIAAALCLAIGIVQPAHAQSTGTQPVQPAPQPQQPAAQGQPPQAPAPAQNPPPSLAPPISKEEEDAYKAFFDLASGQGPLIISQGEAFLGRYPSSR